MTGDHSRRMKRARLALAGLSLGDAFGERFFGKPERVKEEIRDRLLPPPVWRWTDDTAMALSVVEELEANQGIESDALVLRFARRHREDPVRGYGQGAHTILNAVHHGAPWRKAAASVFGGGSMGNGGAMRVAPIGAYFADDLNAVIEHACASASPTHLHPDGQAGAIATAVAAALCFRDQDQVDGTTLMRLVVDHTPDGATRNGLVTAQQLGLGCDFDIAVSTLGNGSNVISSDTVPFCIWNAARHLHDYERAMWSTVGALGDRDTTCAIVGGIIAGKVGESGLPQEWIARREPLPNITEQRCI